MASARCLSRLTEPPPDSQNPTTDAPAAEEETGAHFEPVIKLEQTVEVKTFEVRSTPAIEETCWLTPTRRAGGRGCFVQDVSRRVPSSPVNLSRAGRGWPGAEGRIDGTRRAMGDVLGRLVGRVDPHGVG